MKRGLLLVWAPVLAILALFMATRSLRRAEDVGVPSSKSIRVADSASVGNSAPAPFAPARRGSAASASTGRIQPGRPPVVLDIATAAENARIQSTYQNYRTARITENKALQKTLLSVLQRDRDIAMGYAREDAALAETESDRTFALRTLEELGR